MEFKIYFCILIVTNLMFMFVITNGYQLLRIKDTESVEQRSSSDYYNRFCDSSLYGSCGYSYYHMKCENNTCVCDTGFEWDNLKLRCMKTCKYYTLTYNNLRSLSTPLPECSYFDINRYCSGGNQIYI